MSQTISIKKNIRREGEDDSASDRDDRIDGVGGGGVATSASSHRNDEENPVKVQVGSTNILTINGSSARSIDEIDDFHALGGHSGYPPKAMSTLKEEEKEKEEQKGDTVEKASSQTASFPSNHTNSDENDNNNNSNDGYCSVAASTASVPTSYTNQSHNNYDTTNSNNASMSSGSAPATVPRADPHRFKIVVVGDYSVGKTSLIRQLTQRIFSLQSMATIGVEFKEYHTVVSVNPSNLHLGLEEERGDSSSLAPNYLPVTAPTLASGGSGGAAQHQPRHGGGRGGGGVRHHKNALGGGGAAPYSAVSSSSPNSAQHTKGSNNTSLTNTFLHPVTVQIWDIAGQQYCSAMTKQYYRGAHAAIVVADLTKPSTFGVTLDWREDFNTKAGEVALESAAENLEHLGARSTTAHAKGAPPTNKNKSKNKSSGSTNNRKSQNVSGSPNGKNKVGSGYTLSKSEEELFKLPVFLFANKYDLLPETAKGPCGEGVLVGGLRGSAKNGACGIYDHIVLHARSHDGLSGRGGFDSSGYVDEIGCGGSNHQYAGPCVVAERGVFDFANEVGFDGAHVISAKDYECVVDAFNGVIETLVERKLRQEAYKNTRSAAGGGEGGGGDHHAGAGGGRRDRSQSFMLNSRNRGKGDEMSPQRPKKQKECAC